MTNYVGLKISSNDGNYLTTNNGSLPQYKDRFYNTGIGYYKEMKEGAISLACTAIDFEYALMMMVASWSKNVEHVVEAEVIGIEPLSDEKKRMQERPTDCLYALHIRCNGKLYIGSMMRKYYVKSGSTKDHWHIGWGIYIEQQVGDDVIYCGEDYECDNYEDVCSLPPSSRQCYHCGLPPEQHKSWVRAQEESLQQQIEQAREESEDECATDIHVPPVTMLTCNKNTVIVQITKGVRDGTLFSLIEGALYDKWKVEYDMNGVQRNNDGARRSVEMSGNDDGEVKRWHGVFVQLMDGSEKLTLTRHKNK